MLFPTLAPYSSPSPSPTSFSPSSCLAPYSSPSPSPTSFSPSSCLDPYSSPSPTNFSPSSCLDPYSSPSPSQSLALLAVTTDITDILLPADQEERQWAIREYREQKKDVLVATDVASKGLDFPNIKHIINYDMPTDIENYGGYRYMAV